MNDIIRQLEAEWKAQGGPLRQFLNEEKHAIELAIRNAQRTATYWSEQAAELKQELLQYPFDQEIDESSFADLAASCETHGIVVPDELLPEED